MDRYNDTNIAGLGSRKPITNTIPKPQVKIGNKPILEIG